MSSIVRGGVQQSFGKVLLLGAAAALAIGAAGCMNASTAHDVHAQNASGQSGTASSGGNSADSEARSDLRTDGVGQAAADRSTRQAERSEGPVTGPNPLPWSPSARSTPSNSNAGTTNQRILRLTPPSNNQR
ncbi:MAG: hypothetical protein ABI183_16965 [Polyangiaceae bacterium]